MASPVEQDVASQIGTFSSTLTKAFVNVDEGVRQYGRRGVQAADHEVAGLSDLCVLDRGE